MENNQNADILSVLHRIEAMIRPICVEKVRGILNRVLDTPQKVRAYHYSDNRPSQVVESESGISYVQITELWKQWYAYGLGDMISVQGGRRFVRSINLEDVGVSIPSPS